MSLRLGGPEGGSEKGGRYYTVCMFVRGCRLIVFWSKIPMRAFRSISAWLLGVLLSVGLAVGCMVYD